MRKIIILILIVGLSGCTAQRSYKEIASEVKKEQQLFYTQLTALESKYKVLTDKIDQKTENYKEILVSEGGVPTMRNVSLSEEISRLREQAMQVLLEEQQRTKEYSTKLECIIGGLVDPRAKVIKRANP